MGLSLTKEKEEYTKRDKVTKPVAPNLSQIDERIAARKERKGDQGFTDLDALDDRGMTPLEAAAYHKHHARREMGANLTKEREAYEARGGVNSKTVPVAPNIKTTTTWENGQQEAYKTHGEEINSFWTNIRDWAGLAKEKEAYNERRDAGELQTKPSAFTFFYSSSRPKREAPPPTEDTRISTEDMNRYNANLRKEVGEELTRQSKAYEERERDEAGRIVGTQAETIHFASDDRPRKELPEAEVPSSVSALEVIEYHTFSPEKRSQELQEQREAWLARTAEGEEATTEVEEFDLTRSNTVRQVDKPLVLSRPERLKRDSKNQRDELAEIAAKEREKFYRRMGKKPPKPIKTNQAAFNYRNRRSSKDRYSDSGSESESETPSPRKSGGMNSGAFSRQSSTDSTGTDIVEGEEGGKEPASARKSKPRLSDLKRVDETGDEAESGEEIETESDDSGAEDDRN